MENAAATGVGLYSSNGHLTSSCVARSVIAMSALLSSNMQEYSSDKREKSSF